ncbi:uncharacterized protein LOC108911056 [Anoplophora glabripennis]|nr:uncharacterized protein LOC108911056 [Anoplophora glabripennis]
MFAASKSAVFQVLRCSVCVFKEVKFKKISTMNNWQAEMEKFLSMDINKKRDLCKKYETLDNIPTWKQYASGNSLLRKIEAKQGYEIDSSKNAIVADKISVFSGDITTLEVDAIVNAANSSLMGGGGVDGCIHKAAGPNLLAECKTLGGCPTGQAKITGGYKLPAKYVIHTVGPQGEKENLLRNCYQNSLQIMLDKKLESIAFPCISTGIYGYPNESAAHVALYTVRKFLETNSDKVNRVIFCLFLKIDQNIYEGLLQSYFPLK